MKTTFSTSVQVQSDKFTVVAGSGLTRISPTLKLSNGLAAAPQALEVRRADVPHLIEILQRSVADLTEAEARLG